MGCATGTIAAYNPTADNPWNAQRVKHLYRRMAFGATYEQIEAGLLINPSDLVDQLIDNALNAPLPTPPVWNDWTRFPIDDYGDNGLDFQDAAYQHLVEWIYQWLADMRNVGFREKLSFFWSNHFVTQFFTYECSAYLYQYHKLLQEYALGNFRNFAHYVGITPAMLLYLNGNESVAGAPNENYARELMELFTMGQNNGYTEQDISEMARALTGWQASIDTCGDAYLEDDLFDNTDKTIFGQTGNWRNDPNPEHAENVVNLIFTHRGDQVADYICGKLYRFFVAAEPSATIVEEMATTFKNNNFEIAPVLRQLFKSEHFFDEANIGHHIKSPIEMFISNQHTLYMNVDAQTLEATSYFSTVLGQEVFSPVNVAGWPGHRSWINENSLARRWELSTYPFYNTFDASSASWVALAKNLTNNSNDPLVITTALIDYIFAKGMPTASDYEIATTVFKGNIPENYFDDGSWNLDWVEAPSQLLGLFVYLIRLPDFQLN